MTVTTENPHLNGVDVATLFATLDAVKGQNQIAEFQFRATNTWVSGTHSRSTYSGFFGAMQEMEHTHETEVVSDHPAVLVGQDLVRWSVIAAHLMQRIYGTMTLAAPDPQAARAVVDQAEATMGSHDRCSFCVVMLAVPAAEGFRSADQPGDAARCMRAIENLSALRR